MRRGPLLQDKNDLRADVPDGQLSHPTFAGKLTPSLPATCPRHGGLAMVSHPPNPFPKAGSLSADAEVEL
jgi:hypothetical protein